MSPFCMNRHALLASLYTYHYLPQLFSQVQHTLLEATQRAEKAESEAANFATQNRALAAKVHRLALQRVELLNDKDRVERENRDLQIANLQLSNEARMAKAAKADAWQLTNLKLALRQQAAQHEKKMESLKRRTKALLSVILPGGHSKADDSLLAAPGSPTSDSGGIEVEDLWDAPLALATPSTPDVNLRIRSIVGCLYDDTITEDDALAQMTALTQSLVTRPGTATTTSRGCSPLPVPKLGEDGVISTNKVDAGTDAQTTRVKLVVDVATETPAEMSYNGTPCDLSAAPSQGPASPRRLVAGPVPVLDLAALVAQAMEEAPLSGRSTASTSVNATGGPSFSSISQFVLAQPEKLQRLILRHAAATGAKPGQSGFGQPRVPQSPYGSGLPPSATGISKNDIFAGSSSTNLMDPLAHLNSGGPLATRPSFTSRFLGLGGSNAANRASSTAAAPQPRAGNNDTSSIISASGVTVSPAKPTKRWGGTAPPKFAILEGPEKATKPTQPGTPAMSLAGVKLLSGGDDNSNSSSNFSFNSGFSFQGAADLDSDLKELSLGSTALSFFQSGASRR
ncbi:hypothetical protein VOLCADRAFT_117446 [Volvox carteri f. nagariensis]|uniref:Uncharacterized protein n=1 Tax=Volvox carteri f. nagariensis TaxID=3068 RepID=D8TUE7_VOLCA|nr:uncharacterized protein VOLCADRAFT_117446 [Volvox carteri f. nagariensis]EFJ48695.1 hypothetical protein VOLCADRAFT_117446 [Volvox carteri f. nagariensis]|eukprot:XP_002950027.1 hypothetical protein VOLCADRAFT_117446 [Volvox carteri f. nagariensis]